MDAAVTHSAFILAAYLLVGGLLVALIGWMIVNHRRTLSELRRLEKKAPGREAADE